MLLCLFPCGAPLGVNILGPCCRKSSPQRRLRLRLLPITSRTPAVSSNRALPSTNAQQGINSKYIRMYIRMCGCMDVCMCVCMYVCMYVFVCMYACICGCMDSPDRHATLALHTWLFPLAQACVSPARSLLHMDSGYNMYGLHGWSGSQQALHSTLWSYALDEDHDPRGGIQQWQMMRSSKFLRFTYCHAPIYT